MHNKYIHPRSKVLLIRFEIHKMDETPVKINYVTQSFKTKRLINLNEISSNKK